MIKVNDKINNVGLQHNFQTLIFIKHIFIFVCFKKGDNIAETIQELKLKI